MAKDETMIDKFVEKCDIVKILWSYARICPNAELTKEGKYRIKNVKTKDMFRQVDVEIKKVGNCLKEKFLEFEQSGQASSFSIGARSINRDVWLKMKQVEYKSLPFSISVFIGSKLDGKEGDTNKFSLTVRVALEVKDADIGENKDYTLEDYHKHFNYECTEEKLDYIVDGDKVIELEKIEQYKAVNPTKKIQIGKFFEVEENFLKFLSTQMEYDPDTWDDEYQKKREETNDKLRTDILFYFGLIIPFYKHIVGVPKKTIEETQRNIIFYGPPGTGKTREAKKRAAELLGRPSLEDTPQDQYAIVQFHPGYTYSDFVEGIGAVEDGFQPQKKGFRELVERANKNPYNKYVLIIDEINRANVAEVFGELIYGLEYRGSQITTPLSGVDMQGSESEVMEPLCIPKNLAVIGTMNTADKSLMPLDYAVRRRFAFEYFGIDKAKENFQATDNVKFAENICNQVQKDIDKYIVRGMDSRDVMPGISYFIYYMDKGGKKHLEYKLRYELIPLLKEYVKNGMFSKRNGGKEFIEAIQSKDGEDYINTLRKLETPDR